MKTPYYYIKEKDLQFDIKLLRNSLENNWGNYVMGYSVKTNSLPWLLNYLRKEGFYAEVVSDTEYDLASRLGYTDDQVIYNGPIKDKDLFCRLILSGNIVNLDSNYELEWLEELAGNNQDKVLKVGLRINSDIRSMCPEEVLPEENGGRFGYCYENGVLTDIIDRINSINNVSINGLHLHSSTQSRSVEVFAALAGMAVKIAREYKLKLEYVDMGGGYFGGRDDKPSYADYIPAICEKLREFFNPEETRLIVEPGVSLISRAITFATSVIDTKRIRDISYVITDGSRLNLNPQVTRHVYPHHMEYNGDISGREKVDVQWICGSSCMEYDRLFEIREDVKLKPGDMVIYDTAGGYTICLTPLFIHYFPAIYVERMDGSIFTARDPWTNDEYMMKNHIE